MKVYLVRHAQSAAHAETKRQSPDSPLGKEGAKQVELLAQRLKKENIEIILSSKWDRASQTAEKVSKKLKVKMELFEGIHEREQHPSLYGAELSGEIHKRYIKESEKFEHNLDWKFGGKGESLRDLIERVIKFQKHLIKHHKDQSVLVVTHGIFITTFVIIALLGEDYGDKTFYKIFQSLSFENTAITLMEYDSKGRVWRLRYLNDHMHLK